MSGKSFTAPAGAITSAVKYAAKWLDPKPRIPAHGGLLFAADGPDVWVCGMNENATARAKVTVDGDPPEAFVVAGRLIASLVETFPKGNVTFELDDSTLIVSAGRFRATLPVMAESDYPTVPAEAPEVGTVDGTSLADAVRRVATAAKLDGENAGLRCVQLDFGSGGEDGRPITLTATDRFRAARQSVDWQCSDALNVGTALVFADVLADAIDAFDIAESVTIGLGDTLSLSTPQRSLVTRVVEAQFPPLDHIFAMSTTATLGIRSKDVVMPLKRVDLIRGKNGDGVRLDLVENLLTISAPGGESGDGDEEIDVVYDGPETTILMRSATLRGVLDSAPGDRVTVAFTPGTTLPAIVTAPADPTWRYLMVPLTKLGGSA